MFKNNNYTISEGIKIFNRQGDEGGLYIFLGQKKN
jgi:hypothetical protein